MLLKKGVRVRARRGLGGILFGRVEKGTRGTIVQTHSTAYFKETTSWLTYKVRFGDITIDKLTDDDIARA